MDIRVRVLPGTLLCDNRTTYGPGEELNMPEAEATRRIRQGKVERVGQEPSLNGQPGKLNAGEVIAAAQAATTMDALVELKNGEDRKTVLAAIEAREQELSR